VPAFRRELAADFRVLASSDPARLRDRVATQLLSVDRLNPRETPTAVGAWHSSGPGRGDSYKLT
jgi:hypothetical protein